MWFQVFHSYKFHKNYHDLIKVYLLNGMTDIGNFVVSFSLYQQLTVVPMCHGSKYISPTVEVGDDQHRYP